MTLLNISNHHLSSQQLELVKQHFGLDEISIVNLPKDLAEKYSNLPMNLEDRKKLVGRILDWVKGQGSRLAHLDGDAHFVHLILKTALEKQLDVKFFKFFTRREVLEQKLPDGSVKTTRVFRPVAVLEYV